MQENISVSRSDNWSLFLLNNGSRNFNKRHIQRYVKTTHIKWNICLSCGLISAVLSYCSQRRISSLCLQRGYRGQRCRMGQSALPGDKVQPDRESDEGRKGTGNDVKPGYATKWHLAQSGIIVKARQRSSGGVWQKQSAAASCKDFLWEALKIRHRESHRS